MESAEGQEMPSGQPTTLSDNNNSLRQRRSSLQEGHRKKSIRRLEYQVTRPDSASLTRAQERVFLNMQLRKMQRRVRGRKQNKGLAYELCSILCLLIVIVLWGYDYDVPAEQDQSENVVAIAVAMVWLVVSLLVIYTFQESPFIRMITWMVVYIPLVTAVAIIFMSDEVGEYNTIWAEASEYWSLAFLFVTESFVFFVFMSYYFLYPRIMKSAWLWETPGRVAKFWNVGLVSDWTFNYTSHIMNYNATRCQFDYTCKYEGDTDPETGLPDGLGRWLDDAWEGEQLTGYWKQGEPVAPFSSWNVGTDDAVGGVRVAYFKATDDDYDKNNFFAFNDKKLPECGVASVECSISGNFYKHLPSVNLIEGPYTVDQMPVEGNNPIMTVLSHLFQVGEAAAEEANHSSIGGGGLSAINILATDPRGIQVVGHVYEPTGRFYSPDIDRITVEVDWSGQGENERKGSSVRQPSARFLQKTLFMPKAASMGKLIEVEFEDSSEEGNEGDFNDEADRDNNNADDENSGLAPFNPDGSVNYSQQSSITDFGSLRLDETPDKKISTRYRFSTLYGAQVRMASLRVQNWTPYYYKEALIFCPGYNSCMKESLQSFGQFLAMTKLSFHVYPFVFVWPGSYNLGYSYASKAAATDINQQNMLKLVRGLAAAGIRRVHFMSHSMGVQTLLGAFRDRYDERGERLGRSEVSRCFHLDPDFDSKSARQDDSLMICKTITMLNPDFPLEAFVDRAFLSIRRVCRTVTVVGDRNDRALYWSSVCNGTAPHFGYEFPEVLRPTPGPYKPKSFARMKRIGHSIDSLYFPQEVGHRSLNSDESRNFRRLLFNQLAPIVVKKQGENSNEPFWLDMDVIDMTGLDTNIKGMRHSGFSLNGMLLNDLEELIASGKRAMKRSSLLYREGNMFSYAHAPAFVSQ